MLRQELNQTSVVRQNVDRPRLKLCQNALMKVVDLIGRAMRLANTLTVRKMLAVPPNA